MSKKLLRALVAVALIIALFVAWHFGIRPRLSLFQAWDGVIKESYRVRDADKDVYSPHRAEYLFYNHYWRVECDDGLTLDVEVPYTLWQKGAAGMRVVKKSGSRYPQLAFEEERGSADAPKGAAAEPQAKP